MDASDSAQLDVAGEAAPAHSRASGLSGSSSSARASCTTSSSHDHRSASAARSRCPTRRLR